MSTSWSANWNQQPYGTLRYLSSMKNAAALLPNTTALLFQKAGAQFSALLKQSRDLNITISKHELTVHTNTPTPPLCLALYSSHML